MDELKDDARDDRTPAAPDAANASGDGDTSLREQVEHVLNLIRPAVQSDGGDLELVGISDDGVVSVRFHGACVGCPSSTQTLQAGIEKNLKDHIPGVKAVEAVN